MLSTLANGAGMLGPTEPYVFYEAGEPGQRTLPFPLVVLVGSAARLPHSESESTKAHSLMGK